MEQGIDISAWQGSVSVDTFKKHKKDIPNIILRSSYTTQQGFNLRKDKYFDQNIKAANKAGVKKIGVYHYSQAISELEAEKEAEFVINILKPYKQQITLPVTFDWEFGGRLSGAVARKLGKQRCKQICDAFCRKIRSAGYTPMIYANLSTLNGYIASDIYKYWNIWVAQYSSKCNYKHPHYAWQYSSSGRVSGIPGAIDMNWIYGTNVVQHPAVTYKGTLPKLPFRGWFTSGDSGAEVKKLQSFLNWYGGYGLKIDGKVGRLTIDAVKQYQGREKLKIDGAFGKQCLERAKIVKR